MAMEMDEIVVSECVRKGIESMSIIPFIIANNATQKILMENERREREEREKQEKKKVKKK